MRERSVFQSAVLSVLFASCLCSLVFAQQRRRETAPTIPRFPTGTALNVRVVFPDDRPVGDLPVRIQLLSVGGAPLQESYVNQGGEASFNSVAFGSYVVSVSGPDIEEASARVDVQPHETSQIEFIRVKLKTDKPTTSGSSHPTVSTAELRIPDKARKEFEKGNKALLSHKPEDAIDRYDKAISIYPQYASAYNNRGTACMIKKDYGCARASFEKAIAVNNRLTEGLMNLSRLDLMEHNYLEAENLLKKALSVDPLNLAVLTMIAYVELQQGNYDAAVENARKVHNGDHSKYAVAHCIAGQALEIKHSLQEATLEYQLCDKESPPNSPGAQRAREALARLGRE